jgi:hypothetical protein
MVRSRLVVILAAIAVSATHCDLTLASVTISQYSFPLFVGYSLPGSIAPNYSSTTTTSVQPQLFWKSREEFQSDYDDGYGRGHVIGYRHGLAAGKQDGWDEGTVNGKSAGFDAGWDVGYEPAFDRAYYLSLPIGHAAGWEVGLLEGFEEGLHWAPVILGSGSFGISGATYVVTRTPGSGSGLISISSGGMFGDILTELHPASYDWAKHYFNEGFADGKEAGLAIGTDEGFSFTYPRAYDAGYKRGYGNGILDGREQGTVEGNEEGYDAGWDLGYDDGFDYGFYSGLRYHHSGELLLPAYSGFSGSGAFVPEPASAVLMGIASLLAIFRRRPH